MLLTGVLGRRWGLSDFSEGLMARFEFFFLLSASVVLSSCAGPGIGVKNNFHEVGFTLNKALKKDVLEVLGLPQKIEKDPDGKERFIYAGDARMVGLCVRCSQGMGPAVIPSAIYNSTLKRGAQYVFNPAGVLVEKYEPGLESGAAE